MPGTPATTPRLLIPRYANSDAFDFAGHVNAVSDMIDSKVKKQESVLNFTPSTNTTPATGPARPSSPADGDTFFLRSAAVTGLVIRPSAHQLYRYNSTTAQWEFVGGSPFNNGNDIAYSNASITTIPNQWNYGNSTVPGYAMINVPYAGEYILEWGALDLRASIAGSGGRVDIGVSINGGTPASPLVFSTQDAIDGSFPPSRPAHFRKRVVVGAAATFMVGWFPTVSGALVGGAYVSALPVFLS